MSRHVFLPSERAFSPVIMFGFLGLLGATLLMSYSLISGGWSPFASGTPPALSTTSLRKESPCVKRLLIKRVNDGHLVKTEDVSRAEAVCEQAAVLEETN